LIPSELSKRRDRDRSTEKEEIELLEQIQSTDATAGRRYLEYLVLVKRHTVDSYISSYWSIVDISIALIVFRTSYTLSFGMCR